MTDYPCHHRIEGQPEAWKELKKTVTGFSNRRNDIAHASAELLFDLKTEKPWGASTLCQVSTPRRNTRRESRQRTCLQQSRYPPSPTNLQSWPITSDFFRRCFRRNERRMAIRLNVQLSRRGRPPSEQGADRRHWITVGAIALAITLKH